MPGSLHSLPTSLATISFANESWIWIAIGFGAVALLVLAFGYFHSPLRGPSRVFALILKALGFLVLALALLEPVRVEEQPKKHANDVVIVADNSSGLSVALNEGEPPPASLLRDALVNEDPALLTDWMEEIAETFRLQTFLFDRTLRRTKDFSDLSFDRPSSNLASAIDSIERRFEKRPHAATVVLTDGNLTDTEQWEKWIARADPEETPGDDVPSPAPIFPVVIGSENPDAQDLAITRVDSESTQFEDARVMLTVEASARGPFENPVEVYVVNDKEEELATKFVTFPNEPGFHSVPVRLRLAAIPPGISFLTVGIRQVGDAPIKELTEQNNAQKIAVNQGSGPYRILYVSGRPNWEYKFLRRSIAEDAELDLVALIRIAKREPKFEWRGRSGESSNPLFRGFQSDIPEETQRYDEPVLVRLNTAFPEELRDGFPGSEEELFPHYRAIILDDVEADLFTVEQQELIDRFVARRGGTLVMLGGQESFQSGGWNNTPVGRLLPVYLDRLGSGAPSVEAAFNLTREGWLEPWMRLESGKEQETTRLAYMTPFFAVNQIRAIKPGASVLATVTDNEDRSLPAIITQRYGEGKAAAVTIGDFWRWGMKDPDQQEELATSWRQLLRWSVTEVPTRVEMEKEEIQAGGLPVTKLSVRVRDEAFEAQDDANVLLTVTEDDGSTKVLSAEPSLEEPGLFTAEFSSDSGLGYRIESTVLDGEGTEVGTDEVARSLNPEAREFARMGPNLERLEQLAAATGGRVLTLAEIGDLPGLLDELELPVAELRQRPLWHTPWLFLIALLLFLGEWILRRKQGIL